MNLKKLTTIFFIIIISILNISFVLAEDKKPIELWDILKWKYASEYSLSDDGVWFAWRESLVEEDGQVKVCNSETDSLYCFDAGFGKRGNLKFSSNNNYLLFKVFPTKKDKDDNKKTPNKLGIVTLETGKDKYFENVKTVKIPEEKSDWIAIQFNIPDSRGKDAEWTGSDLIIYNLVDSSYFTFGNVSEFEFDKHGQWLAMIVNTENMVANCVYLRNMKTGELKLLDSDKALYSRISWTDDGDAFCFLKSKKDEDYKQKPTTVIGIKDITKKNITKIIFDPKEMSTFPEEMTVSSTYKPKWKEELNGFFFGIKSLEMTDEAKAKKDSTKVKKDEKKHPDMVIWHWKDKNLQSFQWVNEKSAKDYSYLSYFDIKNNSFQRLCVDTLKHFTPAKRGKFSISNSREKYELQASLEGRRYCDIFVHNLETGEQYKALKKNRWYFGASPDNKYFLYFKEGHFYTYDMEKRKSINITQKVPTTFIDVEDDHNVKNPPVRPLDWSEDSKYVFLSDGWDTWKVDRLGKKFSRLTKDGKKKKIRYGNEYKTNLDNEGINLSEDVYFRIYNEVTKQNGIGLLRKGKSTIEKIMLSDNAYYRLLKAKKNDTFVYTKEDFQNYPDFYITDKNFKDSKKLTDINPQQKEYFWCSGRKIINYVTEYGDSLQGVLYLPANYEEGKKYPTIVYMYEKLSQRSNDYLYPYLAGIMNTSYYTSNGYAIFKPDITFKLNDPGISSVKCIMAGIEAALETGIIDKDHVGIQGHSWGGYQTSFIITQTDFFKAACAGAPLTNMLSMYSSIYWNTGNGNMAIFESSQGRFLGGYWDNLDAYTRNSPVYQSQNVKTPLLMLHNDKDGAVDWNQGIEYYNTLRRQGKPVVMLEYKGENHGLRKTENRKDYTVRMKEFFDYYLKNEPAPSWWTEGVDYIDLEKHLKEREKLLVPEISESDTTEADNAE